MKCKLLVAKDCISSYPHVQATHQKLLHRHQLGLVGDGESKEEGDYDDDRVHQGGPHCTDLKAL